MKFNCLNYILLGKGKQRQAVGKEKNGICRAIRNVGLKSHVSIIEKVIWIIVKDESGNPKESKFLIFTLYFLFKKIIFYMIKINFI